MLTQPTPPHVWYSPAQCAALLGAHISANGYRAACPAHDGGSANALSIRPGTDQYGHPITLLHCFAHNCDLKDICAAMGIEVRNLFCIQPAYAKETAQAPRARSPRIHRLKSMENPTPDAIAQMLLEEMIVSDPQWIEECAPARAKLWELAQASPKARELFTRALKQATLQPLYFWDTLAREQRG